MAPECCVSWMGWSLDFGKDLADGSFPYHYHPPPLTIPVRNNNHERICSVCAY